MLWRRWLRLCIENWKFPSLAKSESQTISNNPSKSAKCSKNPAVHFSQSMAEPEHKRSNSWDHQIGKRLRSWEGSWRSQCLRMGTVRPLRMCSSACCRLAVMGWCWPRGCCRIRRFSVKEVVKEDLVEELSVIWIRSMWNIWSWRRNIRGELMIWDTQKNTCTLSSTAKSWTEIWSSQNKSIELEILMNS